MVSQLWPSRRSAKRTSSRLYAECTGQRATRGENQSQILAYDNRTSICIAHCYCLCMKQNINLHRTLVLLCSVVHYNQRIGRGLVPKLNCRLNSANTSTLLPGGKKHCKRDCNHPRQSTTLTTRSPLLTGYLAFLLCIFYYNIAIFNSGVVCKLLSAPPSTSETLQSNYNKCSERLDLKSLPRFVLCFNVTLKSRSDEHPGLFATLPTGNFYVQIKSANISIVVLRWA